MLLDEDPAVLIHECIGNFNINPDRAALSRISSSLSTLSESRNLRLGETVDSLRRTTRRFNALSQQHAVTLSNHDPTQHASSILFLDAQKFKVAKESSALEIESERLESELSSLQAQLKELESRGIECGVEFGESYASKDQTLLRLKLYRSLGIDVETEGDERQKRAVVVRNVKRGAVRVIDIDPQLSGLFYANYLWQAL